MKIKLIVILIMVFSLPSLSVMAQDGFTNKAEAENRLNDTLKEGKWMVYLDSSMLVTSDTTAPYYRLTTYKDGMPVGIERDYYNSGILAVERPLMNGKKNGIVKMYYPDGKLGKEFPYENDKLNGEIKNYYDDGKLQGEAFFKDDKKNGMYTTYYESGKIDYQSLWTDDKANGITKEYYENGNLKEEMPYVNGKMTGIFKTYYENGILELYDPVSEDKTNGIYKEYYESGKLKMEGPYIDDKENGVWKQYYEDGKLKRKSKYTNGDEGSITIYDDSLVAQVTDKDGNTYKTIKIGTQQWLTSNLNVSHFRNGDIIPEAEDSTEWENAGKNGKPAWCYYNGAPANGEKYGKLYNWYAANDPRGLAPEGWHVPSILEWHDNLITYLGGEDVAGGKMKTSSGWIDNGNGDGIKGTNESGFTALPGGFRFDFGTFLYVESVTGWWSTSEFNTNLCLYNESNAVSFPQADKADGYSIRCVKDL
jgi:uncharacterized protein (TIGR02145 family)